MEEVDRLRKRIQRERLARKEAEKLLEERALQLYYANEKLKSLNQNLEVEVEKKTAELERQKERYQMLVDSAQDIIFVTSKDGFFQYVNPVGLQLVSYDKDQVLGAHYTDLIVPEYVERVANFYVKQVSEKKPISYLEFPIICGDGRTMWVGQKLSLQIIDGEVVELTAIARDISDRVEKDREIAELNLRFSAILRNLQEGILLENEERKIVLVNKEFCNLFGVPAPPEAMIGVDCAASAEQSKYLFTDPDVFLERVEGILKKRKIVTGDTLELTDGRFFTRDYIPIFDEGHYKGHLWRYADITEERKIEIKIRNSEEKYRGIIENMQLGLMEVDRDGIITKPYEGFCQMTGYQPEELIGKHANSFLLPDESVALMREQDKNRKQGQPGVFEIKMKVKGGGEKWVMISGAPFYDVNGDMIGSIGIHYDITHQKQLQRELELARQEAERARDAEKDFLANMSHEIRNPINSIVGMTHLLYDTPLGEEQLEYLKNIKYSSEVLLALVSDILDISKISQGRMEPYLRSFNLHELIGAISNTYKFRIAGKPIACSCEIDPAIPDALETDTTFLNQILLNLLGNAIKFTHEGEVSLNVRLKDLNEEKATVEFRIKDTGIGIPPDRIDHIFERFSQAGKATSSEYGGTGLGLPITKQLVELLHGEIVVESQEGLGTCFTFWIPFPRHTSDLDQGQIPKVEGTSKEQSDLSILIVEDNNTNRLYLERTLAKWNFRFQSCKNGVEALDALQEDLYDLILMDIRMPEMDGYETTIRLRSNAHNPNANIPIIALTASALTDEKEKALAAGMNYHLTKPFTPESLLGAIREFFPIDQDNGTLQASFHWPDFLSSDELEEMYEGDLEHAQMIFQLFSEDMPSEFGKLAERIQKKDWTVVAEQAHKIKPHFKMVGKGDLSELLSQIEMEGKHAQPDEAAIEECFSKLQMQMETLYASVKQALEQFNEYIIND